MGFHRRPRRYGSRELPSNSSPNRTRVYRPRETPNGTFPQFVDLPLEIKRYIIHMAIMEEHYKAGDRRRLVQVVFDWQPWYVLNPDFAQQGGFFGCIVNQYRLFNPNPLPRAALVNKMAWQAYKFQNPDELRFADGPIIRFNAQLDTMCFDLRSLFLLHRFKRETLDGSWPRNMHGLDKIKWLGHPFLRGDNRDDSDLPIGLHFLHRDVFKGLATRIRPEPLQSYVNGFVYARVPGRMSRVPVYNKLSYVSGRIDDRFDRVVRKMWRLPVFKGPENAALFDAELLFVDNIKVQVHNSLWSYFDLRTAHPGLAASPERVDDVNDGDPAYDPQSYNVPWSATTIGSHGRSIFDDDGIS